MIEFLLFPLITGLAIALAAGPLGSFMVWRRMSYFGDTLAHSGLLGISLGLMFNLNLTASVITVSLIVSLLLIQMQKNAQLSTDTLLSVLSHSSLAFGLLFISFAPQRLVNLESFLMGDFLTVSQADALFIGGMSLSLCVIVVSQWRKLLAVTVDEDLARLEGINVEFYKLLLTCLTAVFIAVAMKIIGILLITALLIIPTATVRSYTRSPEAMVGYASLVAVCSLFIGIYLSFMFDLAPGPAIICVASVFYFIAQITGKVFR